MLLKIGSRFKLSSSFRLLKMRRERLSQIRAFKGHITEIRLKLVSCGEVILIEKPAVHSIGGRKISVLRLEQNIHLPCGT